MSGTVIELSAIFVARIICRTINFLRQCSKMTLCIMGPTFLLPASGLRKTRCWFSDEMVECRGSIVQLLKREGMTSHIIYTSEQISYFVPERLERRSCISLISGIPGRNTSTVPLTKSPLPYLQRWVWSNSDSPSHFTLGHRRRDHQSSK